VKPFLPFLPVAMLGFGLFGAMLVLVGASQNELQAAFDLDLTETGMLGSAVVLGIGAGVLAGGPLVDRWPRRPLFFVAGALTGTGLCLLGPGQGLAAMVVLLALAGFGGGLYETILNSAAIERDGERAVRVVAVMHAAATVGAILTPLGINALSMLEEPLDWAFAFRVVGGAHLALALLALAVPLGRPQLAARHARDKPIVTRSLVWLCVAAFAYVGVESAITIFAIPYAEAGLDLGADRGRTAISVFWMGLLVGRLLFALRAGIEDARFAIAAGGASALVLAAGIALAWSQLELMLAVTGLALGGVFPLLVALAGRRTAHATGTGVAMVAGLGSAGGFVAPWITGVLGDTAGMSIAFGALALWCAAIALAALLAER
jgi:fucose permease